MYLVLFTYSVSPEEIDALLPEHYAHLDRYYREGLFLASGPQDGQRGGVLLADGPAQRVEAAVAGDPFLTEGVASVQIIPFLFFHTVEELASLRSDAAETWRASGYRITQEVS